MFRSHLFGSAAVVTSDAEVSRAVLQSDARAFVPWYPRSLTELMGKSSILLINGSLQRRVHGLVGAFFKSPQLKAQVTAGMQRRLAPALAAWRAQGPGARVRIQDQAKAVRAPLLCRLCHYLYLTALLLRSPPVLLHCRPPAKLLALLIDRTPEREKERETQRERGIKKEWHGGAQTNGAAGVHTCAAVSPHGSSYRRPRKEWPRLSLSLSVTMPCHTIPLGRVLVSLYEWAWWYGIFQ